MNILILGAGIMQIPALKKAKEMGLFVLCADGNPDAIGKNYCDVFYPIDIKDKNGLLEVATKFHEKHGLNGVFTVGTDFSSSVAWITENLSLPGIKYQSALNATDKIRMRSCFKESNIPSPSYVEYSSDMDIEMSIKGLSFPLVVKPVDSMGARGVVRVNSINELKDNVFNAIKFSRTSRAIIEEYIDGPEFSLDALIINGEVHILGFADRIIEFPPYFVEMGHNIPTNISEEDKKSIIEVFSKGIKSLGIDYGCAKGDMKLSENGPVIGEIAARLSGGYMSGWTFPYSSGIDLIKGGIQLSLGQDVTILEGDNLSMFSSERSVISIPGYIKSIEQPKKNSKDIMNTYINVEVGDKVNFPINNVEKCGNIISRSKDRKGAIKAAEQAVSDILIRLEPNKWETDKFLFNHQLDSTTAYDFEVELLKGLDEDVEIDGKTIYVKKIDKILKSRKKDRQYRTVNSVIKKLSEYYNVEFIDDSSCGYDFYLSLINGSLQGVLYYLDSLEI
ncbi:ATP-grasp domain-containing protein [Thiospirochaeta perfilievii]|uniref:ATP-grasp domain-containing protein n=1 Tax=Thiospirochaeta perfilievii TaxID=252967 RepID=A0A5C1Q8M3_9SPIO|nr:ATP-grasp domain-containing protein [Thiospirochaeta perfilievii]QEN03236.1 ATP-grasp domain-containing protein [Thiospirochaeta perfilievii]